MEPRWRGVTVDVDLRYPEGKWVGAGEPILYITGSFYHLVDLETIFLQKLGPACVAAYNAYAMCAEMPKTAFLAMDARHCAGAEMAEGKGLPFRAATDGENVSGKFTGTVQLSSGKFAVVEKSHEFTLVPWRPVIDRQLGREVMGVVQGGSVSWQLGRQRGISL